MGPEECNARPHRGEVNRRDYNRLTSDQFKGRKARTLRKIESRLLSLPVGSIVTIVRKFSGFEIATPECQCCGVSVFMTRVGFEALDLLPTD